MFGIGETDTCIRIASRRLSGEIAIGRPAYLAPPVFPEGSPTMADLTLTKEELRVLVQMCNHVDGGSPYFYRGKTLTRNAARIREKAVRALGESHPPLGEDANG